MAEHKILKQKVYHNGTSMVVLKAGDRHEVPERLVSSWADEGVIAKPKVAAAPDDDASADREPAVGDTVTVVKGKFGWHEITVPWLDAPIKVRGTADADAKVAELKAMIPAGDSGGAPVD